MKKIRLVANLSFAVACFLGAYLFVMCSTSDDNPVVNKSENFLFDKIQIRSSDADNNQATLLSDKVKQGKDNEIELVNPIANIDYQMSKGQLSAGSFISKDDKCKLQSDITLQLSGGLKITTDFADVDIKNKSAKADKKVYIEYNGAKISADSYDVNLNKNTVILSKNVVAVKDDSNLSCDYFWGIIGKKGNKYTLSDGTLKGKIIYKSNSYNVNTDGVVKYKNDKLTFMNKATINGKSSKKNFILSSNNMTILLNENSGIKKAMCENGFSLKVNGNTIVASTGIYENNIITAEGNVSIKGPHGVANCKKAVYNTISGKLNMTNTGGVIFRKKS